MRGLDSCNVLGATMRPTSVYVMECAGYTKIGVAFNPAKRLKEINTGAPVRAVLVTAREFECSQVAHEVELRLHRVFARHRSNGEWFDITPARAARALRQVSPLKPSGVKGRSDDPKAWLDRPREETLAILALLTQPEGAGDEA